MNREQLSGEFALDPSAIEAIEKFSKVHDPLIVTRDDRASARTGLAGTVAKSIDLG